MNIENDIKVNQQLGLEISESVRRTSLQAFINVVLMSRQCTDIIL